MFEQEAIEQDLSRHLYRRYSQIHEALYRSQVPPKPAYDEGRLHQNLGVLIAVANGTMKRSEASEDQIADILEMTEQLIDLLFGRVYDQPLGSLPPYFWNETSVGQMLAHVQAWLRQDDLISLSDAAQLLYPELAETNLQAARMRVKRLTEQGRLMQYRDLRVHNRMQQLRVSRQAVEALGYAQNAGTLAKEL
jgi:hypothetical protein